MLAREAHRGAASQAGWKGSGIVHSPGGDGWVSGGDTGASRSRKGSGKGHTADRLEPVHSKSEKQGAAGISGASLLKAMALPQGRVLAQGALF